MKETVQQTKQRYALYGAQYKIDALQQEIDKIKKAFPSIQPGELAATMVSVLNPTEHPFPQPQRKKRTWTAKQRAEASKRAKAFWAKRRKG